MYCLRALVQVKIRLYGLTNFKPSSDKRYIVGGRKTEGDLNLSDEFIQLLVATQADGYLAKEYVIEEQSLAK